MKKSLFSGVAVAAMLALGGHAYADLLVGIGAPLTGPNAAYGAQIQKGAEAAAEVVNAAGGVNGERSNSFWAMTFPMPSRAFRLPTSLLLMA